MNHAGAKHSFQSYVQNRTFIFEGGGDGLTSAAAARPSTSPLHDPFSADRGRRIRSTGTCAVPRHREAALGSKWPRSRGKSVVQPGPYDHFAAVPILVNSKKWAIPAIQR